MTYELAKELKDAGFPQHTHFFYDENGFAGCVRDKAHGIPENVSLIVSAPSIGELITECGEEFSYLSNQKAGWYAYATKGAWRESLQGYCEPECCGFGTGSTPETAVARLWLALNRKV